MMSFRIIIYFVLSLLFTLENYASELPDWAKNQSRMLIGEDITYWGTGLGKSPEIALFKAEFMSIRGIKSECGGYVSKGISIPKRKVLPHSSGYVAYVRGSIPFVECDYNKTPMAKSNKNLKNPYMEKGLQLYDKLISNEFEKNDKEKTKSIKKEVLNFLRIKNKEQEARISAIEEELRELRKRPVKQNITIYKKEVHLHGSEAKYEECMQDYDDLMYEAQQASYKNKVSGNLVGKHSVAIYNKAQRKLYQCQNMKIKK